jgi:hypothetical protein
MPRRVVCVASRALPMRVGFCGRGTTKRVTLGESASFSIATFQFLDLGKEQTEPALLQSLGFSDLNLVTRFAGQSGIQRNPRQ